MTKSQWKVTLWLSIFLLLIVSSFYVFTPEKRLSFAMVGNPVKIQRMYEAWKTGINRDSHNKSLAFKLVTPDSHAGNAAGLVGSVEFNFEANKIIASIEGGKPDKVLELWVSRETGLYAKAPDESLVRKVGTFSDDGYRLKLIADMNVLTRDHFRFDQVIVIPEGSTLFQNVIMAASPGVFEKLYVSEQIGLDEKTEFQIIAPAFADVATGFPDVFNDIVAQGEDLFFNEAFAGNGRSCGTCHPAENNFTIDPAFIASLPPDDPLFVAEFVPALIFGDPANLDQNGKPQRFENPVLMRAFGLIVENVDGMGDLEKRFTMRSVPHSIGMTVSLDAPPNGLKPPDQRTGWSGDGAPSGIVGGIAASGRLRDFILGAIVQHYPLTPARRFDGASPDFRAPTIAEIDALEAFMLSVGRQQEPDLNTIAFKDARAESGKVLFRDGIPPGSFTCNNCHGSAGANVQAGGNPGNRNFNTGVELFLQNRLDDPNITVVGEPRPVDGGFGTNPSGNFQTLEPQPGFMNENFGNQTFNTTSLVEAADSGPFFHNNIIDNLEDAIAFYNSPEFIQTTGNSIPFDSQQVADVASFMRVINALDNIENLALPAASRAVQALAMAPNPDDVIHRILRIAIADTQDAIDVLRQGNIHNSGGLADNAVKQLEKGILFFQQAMNSVASDAARSIQLSTAITHLNNAVNLMKL